MQNVSPTLAIVRVGERPDDVSYERGVMRSSENIGVAVKNVVLPADISLEEFKGELERLNQDGEVHGILIFRPMPAHLPESIIKHLIKPEKDVDCFSPVNMAKIFEGDKTGFYPCTPAAVMEILDYYKLDIAGKNVGIIGRSLVVGKPQAMLMLDRNATVTICHAKTVDLPGVTSKCDIVVAAVGRAKMVKSSYVKEGATVIDVGINMDEQGKLCGDVDFEDVCERTEWITPVPGGVGAVTNNVLLKHVIRAAGGHV